MVATSPTVVDALILSALLRGRRLTSELTSYAISWPEFAYLIEIVWRVDRRPKKPAMMSAVEQLAFRGGRRSSMWIPVLIEIGRLTDLDNTGIQLVMPPPEAAADFALAVTGSGLLPREATNLVISEWRGWNFLATPQTITDRMRRALNERNITWREVDLSELK